MANNEDMCRVMNEDIDYKTKYVELSVELNEMQFELDALRGAIRNLLDAYNARCERWTKG